MFNGKYNIEYKHPSNLTIKDEINVKSYGSYYPYISKKNIDEKDQKKILIQAKKDINTLYSNLIAKKPFDEIKDSFFEKENNLITLKNTYENMLASINQDGDLIELDTKDINLNTISFDKNNDITIRVSTKYEYVVSKQNEGTENNTYKHNGTKEDNGILKYTYKNGKYNLIDFKYFETYFSSK